MNSTYATASSPSPRRLLDGTPYRPDWNVVETDLFPVGSIVVLTPAGLGASRPHTPSVEAVVVGPFASRREEQVIFAESRKNVLVELRLSPHLYHVLGGVDGPLQVSTRLTKQPHENGLPTQQLLPLDLQTV